MLILISKGVAVSAAAVITAAVVLAGCGDRDAKQKSTAEAPNIQVENDRSVFAASQNSFTVTFESNGGSAVASQTADKGGKAEKPADPDRENFIFTGWFTDNGTFENKWDFAETAVTADVTLYAGWLHPAEPEMVFVEGGTFKMGATPEQVAAWNDPSTIIPIQWKDELPVHSVTVSSFSIGKYEVTQKQWELVMGTTVKQQRDKYEPSAKMRGTGDNFPMYFVSWSDAQEFIRRLNKITGKNYRLPTEAEWEYAARGGNQSKGYAYSGGNNIGSVAWYHGNSNWATHPVGGKQPNELGIYDMNGNVEEWCSDWYGENYYAVSPEKSPAGPPSGESRVARGSHWTGNPAGTRVASRNSTLDVHTNFTGFRLALPSAETTATTQETPSAEAAPEDKPSPNTLADSRDDKTYKTVKIGGQVWMAENLNYMAEGSPCYAYDLNNCEKYGRLYDWETAKKACPAGWRLPTIEEWTALTDYANDSGDYKQGGGDALKSASGWNMDNRGNDGSGKDKYGFTALPGGKYSGEIGFHGAGEVGQWWSASEKGSGDPIYWGVICRNIDAFWEETDDKTTMLSVRCVKDKYCFAD